MKLVRNFTASYAGFWFGIQRYRTLGVTYIGLGPVMLSVGNHLPDDYSGLGVSDALMMGEVTPLFEDTVQATIPVGEYELSVPVYLMTIPEYAAMVLERDGVGA